MSKQPQKYLLGGAETYAEKNADYGDSWRKVGEILHLLADGEPVELNSVEDHIAYGLYTRRLDKFARGFHGEFIADEMNFESIEDAHSDEMTYAAMQASNYDARRENRQSIFAGGTDNQGHGKLPGPAARLSAATREIFPGYDRSVEDDDSSEGAD